MGSGSSISVADDSSSWNLNIPHPRNAFSRASIHLVREASSVQVNSKEDVFCKFRLYFACLQEFSNVTISQHAKLASNRNRIKPSRDVDIQRNDLLWDRKRHIFPNLEALKELEHKAIKVYIFYNN